MVEDPNYEYKYDLAVWKSFSARLSLTILGIAAGVFMVAMLMYLYFQEGAMRDRSSLKARTELHDAVMTMRLRAAEAAMRNDTLRQEDFVGILQTVQPYKHSFTLMTDSVGHFVHVGDSAALMQEGIDGLTAAVVCSRLDIISSYKTADLLWSSCLHPRSVGPDLDLCLCHSQDGKAAASVYRVGYEHCRR